MSYSINRQMSHILFTCKNLTKTLYFPIYRGKKVFPSGNVVAPLPPFFSTALQIVRLFIIPWSVIFAVTYCFYVLTNIQYVK